MKYYLLTKNWTYRGDFVLTFWCANSSGYIKSREFAGLYDEEKAFSIAKSSHWDAFPLPQDVVDKLWTKAIYEPEYSAKECEVVINNCHTRKLLRIDPFTLPDDTRIKQTSFIVKGECDWLHTRFEETETVKSDWWGITIREPKEACEYGSQGEVEGKTYKEARKKAYKVVDDMYCRGDFVETMKLFYIKRLYKEGLKFPIKPETWEILK